MVKLLAFIGSPVIKTLLALGRFGLFATQIVVALFTPPFYLRAFIKQFVEIGYFSLPVVALTAIFTGMVLALQSYTGFSRFAAESAVPNVVTISMTRELGPVLTGLMVTARVGAAMTAQIGTMRVSEQIDALIALATNPFKYLIVPRVLAAALALPLLVLVADILGIMGGALVGVYKLGFNAQTYLSNSWNFIELGDVVSGLVKASVFGVIIALMGCYNGYNSNRGAAGVAIAVTYAVVSSSVLILFANYLLTGLFFSVG